MGICTFLPPPPPLNTNKAKISKIKVPLSMKEIMKSKGWEYGTFCLWFLTLAGQMKSYETYPYCFVL